MAFRIRQIEFTADGRQITRDRDIATAELTLGRAAENDIHIADLALDARHARLTLEPDGRVAVQAVGTLGFTLDGSSTSYASIDPASGAELGFGSYRLSVSREADGAVLLTQQRIEAATGEGAGFDPKRSFTLAGVMPSKRTLSWLLAALILGLFLAIPITGNLNRSSDPRIRTISDSSWSPGPLSASHHGLEDSCRSCHVKPFESVRDSSCLTCHKTTHDHAVPNRLAGARATPPLGERVLQAVAHGFGKPGPGACTDCHTEHEGPAQMEPARQKFCADCHGALNERLADTKLGNASDFGTLHPQFTPRIVTDAQTRKLTAVSLDTRPREDNGLIFAHKLHLDPRGGTARMAMNLGKQADYGKSLTCSNCHRPTEDGVRFQPVNMERDCESCHSLAFDKVGTTFRTLRHGDIDQMVADLSASDNGVEPIVTSRRRPGNFASGGTYYANFAVPNVGLSSVQRALSRGGVCGECHTAKPEGGKPGVVPVTQVSRFMAGGWFDHKPHAQEKCSTCHAAEGSASSADLLLPDVKQCRTCHLGEESRKADVPSGCAMCHAYHPSPLAPRQDRDERKLLAGARKQED